MFKAKPSELPQLRPASGLTARGGGGALSAASLLPHCLPLFLGLFLTSPPCAKGERFREKGDSLVSLGLCHLASVPSGYGDCPKLTLSRFFLRSSPSPSTYCSSLMQTTLLWLSDFDDFLKPGPLVFPSLIGGQRGKISFQMIPGQCSLWIPLCSLGHTPLCLL